MGINDWVREYARGKSEEPAAGQWVKVALLVMAMIVFFPITFAFIIAIGCGLLSIGKRSGPDIDSRGPGPGGGM